MLEIVPENLAPLTVLYGRADDALDMFSRRFSADELGGVVNYLDGVSNLYSLTN